MAPSCRALGHVELHISLGAVGTEFLHRSAATAFHAAPCSHLLLAGTLLRVEKKKHTSRHNLRVRWVFHEMPTAAIVLSRQRLSGYSLLDLIQATLSQHHRQRQLPFKGDRHSSAEWTRHARAKPGEPAELWYRGSLGPSARVHGHGGASGRPRRRVATRVSIVSGVRKKYDVRQFDSIPVHTHTSWRVLWAGMGEI